MLTLTESVIKVCSGLRSHLFSCNLYFHWTESELKITNIYSQQLQAQLPLLCLLITDHFTDLLFILIGLSHRNSKIWFLTEVVVLIEVQLIVDAPHRDLLIFRPAGTPAANHKEPIRKGLFEMSFSSPPKVDESRLDSTCLK